MQSIISKVTQLDKEMRMKVKALEEEKAKLPNFLREQRKIISDQYDRHAKEEVKNRKEEIQNELDKTKKATQEELEKSLNELIEVYEQKKDEWIETIYKQCIDSFQEE